jgi:ribonuclease HII
MADFSPDFARELTYGGTVAGIDEAGRGPWAGPVVAAAVILDRETIPEKLLHGLDDSKKLSAKKRELLFAILPSCATIGVGQAEVAEIDHINILQATMLAMRRAFLALDYPANFALVDGNRAPDLPCPVETMVKGDARSLSIAAASIVAKVTRDHLMAQLAINFPGYGWERNRGYGTAEHKDSLERLGVTPHHRKSFAPIAALIS